MPLEIKIRKTGEEIPKAVVRRIEQLSSLEHRNGELDKSMGNKTKLFSCLIRSILIAAMVVLTFGCSNQDRKVMQPILDQLSHGPEAELPSMIYGYKQSSPGAQKVLLGMLQALRPPSPDQHMTFEVCRTSGRFTLIIAHVPWHKGPYAYEHQPIIICQEQGQTQVVGYILPFNDIFHLIKPDEFKDITELSQWFLHSYDVRSPGLS